MEALDQQTISVELTPVPQLARPTLSILAVSILNHILLHTVSFIITVNQQDTMEAITLPLTKVPLLLLKQI